MKQYICVADCHGRDNTCMFSRTNETLQEFQKRMYLIFPMSEGWRLAYSEWNRI